MDTDNVRLCVLPRGNRLLISEFGSGFRVLDKQTHANAANVILQIWKITNSQSTRKKGKSPALNFLYTYTFAHYIIFSYARPQKETLECKDHQGWTALFYAISYGHIDIAHYLIKNGANLNARYPFAYHCETCTPPVGTTLPPFFFSLSGTIDREPF